MNPWTWREAKNIQEIKVIKLSLNLTTKKKFKMKWLKNKVPDRKNRVWVLRISLCLEYRLVIAIFNSWKRRQIIGKMIKKDQKMGLNLEKNWQNRDKIRIKRNKK